MAACIDNLHLNEVKSVDSVLRYSATRWRVKEEKGDDENMFFDVCGCQVRQEERWCVSFVPIPSLTTESWGPSMQASTGNEALTKIRRDKIPQDWARTRSPFL